ncbi:helix-hairpin-helix domain-containing protein [Herbivorax sp. ANBcel31]|uniref:helix-hairpin-helix domain-containing protein n=1 Tax=Herbivorax sp. ANBcel31 TaxID=3069754 RepID=UPI0027B81D75|nr:helix-hairpin-helix domain-containing protein [Herbivorax sp. ANBcel31]MDQ2087385.1 helix-hairpin-helix domain-containing protein [Herbivorax sp. ANBcel31]
MLKEILNHEIKVKKGVLISLIAALVLSVSVIGYLLMGDYGENVVIRSSEGEVEVGFREDEQEDKEEIEVEEINVYVVGEVKKPSVVTLEKGQIIEDAILLAGGPTEHADLENINLAYILTENVMLQIRSKKEMSEDEEVSEDENSSDENFIGMNIVSGSGGAVIGESKDSTSLKININSASKEQLNTLPGVGPVISGNIITLRQEIGGFEKIEDIMDVSGIGDAKFRELKDFITVD